MAGGRLNLRGVLTLLQRKQAELARFCRVSGASINLICNFGQWPTERSRSRGHPGEEELRPLIEQFLRMSGATEEQVATAFNEAPSTTCANRSCPMAADAAISGPQAHSQTEDNNMLRHHRLTPEARQHFRIPRDPFVDEMHSDADVFQSDDIRYVRATLRQTAKHGGMLGVIAQSGGGKSTLRHDLEQWITDNGEPIRLTMPYVLGMGTKDRQSKPLLADDLTRALFRTLDPTGSVPQNTQTRAERMHQLLVEGHRVGQRHALVIEEAHDLATPTLKHLKRFYELQVGFRKMLAVILIGQNELLKKLSEQNPEVREVVQRLEIIQVPPLDNNLEAYLRFKLDRVEASFDSIFEADAMAAIRERLRGTETENRGGHRVTKSVSQCHPLAVNNLVSAAMNEAVRIGAPKVSGALIEAAGRE